MDGTEAKRVVASGYDRITRGFLDLVEAMPWTVRAKYLDVLRGSLPAGARVLELGCGAGVPMTRALAERFDVVGLDISSHQLALARANAPAASLLRGDMVRLPFAGACFDAVAAFYSMTHVPRAEHAALLADVRRVLRTGALLVMTTGAGDVSDFYDEDWLGAPMFFSHFDGATNTRLVEEAGFTIISGEDEPEMERDQPVCFHWIVARASLSER